MGEPRGGHFRRAEGAASDLVGTLLLVAMVVLIGLVVTVAVAKTLGQPAPSDASVALAKLAPGDDEARLTLRNGDAIPLDDLRLTLQRNGSAEVAIPRASWLTPNATMLRPGDTLAVPLSPAAGSNETLRFSLYRVESNVFLAQLASRAGSASAGLPAPALTASALPPSVPADGTTRTRLTVNVSHPAGALAVARIVADLSSVSAAAGGTPIEAVLRDDGLGGDLAGGDGSWSVLVALPPTTPVGTYTISFVATDASGVQHGETTTALIATAAGLGSIGTGPQGAVGFMGSNFLAPSATNFTTFALRNFTWDKLHPSRLDDDFALVRVVDKDGDAWSARIRFEDVAGVAYVRELHVWSQSKETKYVPRNGTGIPLADLALDLRFPVESLQWVHASGDPHPEALYEYSNVDHDPWFVLPVFGQDKTTSNAETSLDTGIYTMEVTFY